MAANNHPHSLSQCDKLLQFATICDNFAQKLPVKQRKQCSNGPVVGKAQRPIVSSHQMGPSQPNGLDMLLYAAAFLDTNSQKQSCQRNLIGGTEMMMSSSKQNSDRFHCHYPSCNQYLCSWPRCKFEGINKRHVQRHVKSIHLKQVRTCKIVAKSSDYILISCGGNGGSDSKVALKHCSKSVAKKPVC